MLEGELQFMKLNNANIVMCAMAGEWGQLTWHPRGLIPFHPNKLPKVETWMITNLETRLYISVDM